MCACGIDRSGVSLYYVCLYNYVRRETKTCECTGTLKGILCYAALSFHIFDACVGFREVFFLLPTTRTESKGGSANRDKDKKKNLTKVFNPPCTQMTKGPFWVHDPVSEMRFYNQFTVVTN